MSPEEIQMHLAAGRYYGRHSACGSKIKHHSEYEADRHASGLNKRIRRQYDAEAYPCFWCSPNISKGDFFWHVGRRMYQDERDLFLGSAAKILEMEEITIDVAEETAGVQLGLVGLRVHNRKYCEGQDCCIHHPSDHHMTQWPLNWRADRKIMERICDHGIGHPDIDDANFRKQRDPQNYDYGVHGCDGCCQRRV